MIRHECDYCQSTIPEHKRRHTTYEVTITKEASYIGETPVEELEFCNWTCMSRYANERGVKE